MRRERLWYNYSTGPGIYGSKPSVAESEGEALGPRTRAVYVATINTVAHTKVATMCHPSGWCDCWY